MSETRTLHRDEVVVAIRGRRCLGREPLDIRCDSVNAVMYRDVIEAYLWLTGTRRVRWLDPAGAIEPIRSPLAAVAGLVRDAVLSLPALWRVSRALGRLERAVAPPRKPSEPLRALYLRTDHWFNLVTGGSVAHTRGVIRSLRERGVQTLVLSTGALRGIPAGADFRLCEPRYELGRNVPGLPELLYNEQVMPVAAQACREHRAGFVYERLSFLGFAGAAVARSQGLPFVCEYNGSPAWAARHWGRRALLEGLALRIERYVLRAADLIVVVSDPIREQLLAEGIDAARILVNPNGVDTDVYRPDICGALVRERYGLGDRLVFGFIGTFGRWHGAEVLAHAFVRLLASYPEMADRVRLLMIGDGPQRDVCERIVSEAGMAARAVFTGTVAHEEGPAHLAACDVLVSPHVPNADGSRFFGSPTKLFEYLAMGRPIIASRLDQIGDVLDNDVSALLVPPADVEALATAMHRLVGDESLRRRLGEAGRDVAVARHTWNAHVARTLDALAARCSATPDGVPATTRAGAAGT